MTTAQGTATPRTVKRTSKVARGKASGPVVVHEPNAHTQLRKVLYCRTPAQSAALISKAPECAYMGRRFGGKSHIGCRKALEYAVHYGDTLQDKPRVSISREERVSMESTTLATMRDEILGHDLWFSLYKPSKDELWLPNGSIIRFFGLDRPGRALGARYSFMFVDQAEQLTDEQFNIAVSCCTQPGFPWTQFFTSYNPENPEHWAFKRYRPDLGNGPRFHVNDRGERRYFADVVLVGEDDLMDLLLQSDRERLDGLDGIWRDRLRYGRWVAFTGIVYDCWDPTIHVVEPPRSWERWGNLPPPSWERVCGVDFGYNPDPYCFLWSARSPEGKLYVYRQDYRLELTTDDQVERIRAINRAEREALLEAAEESGDDQMLEEARELEEIGLQTRLFAEHDADAREMYRRAGIGSKPAKKEIQAGIEAVRNRLIPSQPSGPRLLIVRDSLVEMDRKLATTGRPTCLEEEVSRYTWKVVKSAAGANQAKDVPNDENNHGMDALRYLVHTFDLTRWA